MSGQASQRSPSSSDDLRVRPTAAGWATACVLLAILGAALNTGNNLLYLLGALVIAAVPVSWVISRRMLRSAEAELLLPLEVTAGVSFPAVLRLRSPDHALAGLSWQLTEGGEGRRAVPHVAARSTDDSSVQVENPRRGLLRLRTSLDCPFPWGWLSARRPGPEGEVLVLPAPESGAHVSLREGESADGRSSLRRGRSQDLLEIRDYRAGDDARSIDWKATARRDRTMFRQGAAEEEHRVAVVLDPSPPPGERSEAEALVERAISRAAGALRELHGANWQVRLVLPGLEVSGSELEQLRALARLEIPETALPRDWWRGRLGRGEAHVLRRAEVS